MVKFLFGDEIKEVSDTDLMLADVEDVYFEKVPYMSRDRHVGLQTNRHKSGIIRNSINKEYFVSKKEVVRGFKLGYDALMDAEHFLESNFTVGGNEFAEAVKNYLEEHKSESYTEIPLYFKELNLSLRDSHSAGRTPLFDKSMNSINYLPNVYEDFTGFNVCWGSYRYSTAYDMTNYDLQIFNMSMNNDLTSKHFSLSDKSDKIVRLAEMKGYNADDVLQFMRTLDNSGYGERGNSIFMNFTVISMLGFYVDDMFKPRGY